MRFKYEYEHLNCGLCLDISDNGCPHILCPHIMENLDDLYHDKAFTEAIEDADCCPTYHRPTLALLKKLADYEEQKPLEWVSPPPNEVYADYKEDCEGCPYPAHGFICYDERDGSCLKTDVEAIEKRYGHARR